MLPRAVDGRAYVPGIDGLRAVAVLAVMVYHLDPSWLPGGFVGVDVFFVISGYVVTGSLLRDARLPFGSYLAAFYARRFRRVLPALIVCLTTTAIAGQALIPQAWLSDTIGATALAAFYGASNFTLLSRGAGYFADKAEFNPFTHTWSLGVEEQFYLIFPLLVAPWIRAPGAASARIARITFCAALVASFAWCAWASRSNPDHAFYMLSSRFWELGAGAAARLANDRWRRELVEFVGARALALLSLVSMLACFALADRAGFPLPWALPAVLASVGVIVAVEDSTRRNESVPLLGARPFVAIGLLSYSLYLWHWPVYTLLRWTVGLESPLTITAALAVVLVASTASYRLVEVPTQRGRSVRRLPDPVTVVAGLALACGSWVLCDRIYGMTERLSRSVVAAHRLDWYPYPRPQRASARGLEPGPCKVSISNRIEGQDQKIEFLPRDCESPESVPAVYVLGDSHAMAFQRLLQLAAARTGMPVTVFARGDCAIAGLVRPDSDASEACRAFRSRALTRVLEVARPGDVVWLASLRMPRIGFQSRAFTTAEVADYVRGPVSPEGRAAAEADARAVIAPLTRLGLRVILSAPLPVLPSPPFRCSDAFNRANPVCRPGVDSARWLIEPKRAAIGEALRRLSDEFPTLVIWDPWPVLCPGDPCTAFHDGRPVFFDGDHLSGYGNELLLPSFLDTLGRNRITAGNALPPRGAQR